MTTVRIVLDAHHLRGLGRNESRFADLAAAFADGSRTLHVPAALLSRLAADLQPAEISRILQLARIVPSRRSDLAACFAGDAQDLDALSLRAAERVLAHAFITEQEALRGRSDVCTLAGLEPHLQNRRLPLQFTDLAQPQADHLEALDERLERVLRHGQYIMGPEVRELETALARRLGVKHAISVSNGTVAIELALRALRIGPGDEVITIPFTWISTAEVIPWVGATPVFVDIRPDTFCMDPELLAAAITPRTRAVIPVSLFGQMPRLEEINALAARHGIAVIEDAAQSFGATRHGRASGACSTLATTSFFPSKPLGCYGDGGAVFTDDDRLADLVRALRTHGGLVRHHHTEVGTNARMDTLQAAIVLANLGHFDAATAQRQAAAAEYSAQLTAHGLAGPVTDTGNSHVWAQYTIRVADRAAAAARLTAAGIPHAIYYPACVHQQPAFAQLMRTPQPLEASAAAAREVLSLPMHGHLDAATIRRTVAILAG